MVNFEQLIKDIVKAIKTNGKKEITGQLLQEVLLDMVSKSQDAETESILRDNNLQDIINNIDVVLDAVKEKLAKHEGQIQDHETMIHNNVSMISHNAQEIKRVEDIVDGHSQDITDIKHKDAEQDAEIKNLKETTQIVDLDVEIRNVGGGRYVSSDSAEDIYNYAIKGGNVKIQIDDKKYDFVEYKSRTAYFRNLQVSEDKVLESRIEIYQKDAVFKTVEYTAIFDATPLLTSFTQQSPLSNDFITALNKALSERKLVYVNGNGTIYLLVGTSQSGETRTFTGVGRNSVYVLSYGANKIVSLDTHTIGVDIRIFNNENSVNILNLTTESTNEEILEVFTDSFGEVILPHANDIFNIYQNSDVANNGTVESMVEDSYEIRLAVNMSNFENNLIHRVFYTFSYTPSIGMNSLKITNKIDNIINPSLLTEEKVNKRDAEIAKKADKVDVNEYNISAINGATYASLQEALTALDAYLTAKGIAKSVGVKVTYVQTDVMRAKTYSFVKMGRFTDVANWMWDKELLFYVYTNLGADYDSATDTWSYGKVSNITWDEIFESYKALSINYSTNLDEGIAYNSIIRFTFPKRGTRGVSLNGVSLDDFAYSCSNLEEINFNLGYVYVSNLREAFGRCEKLKRVTSTIQFLRKVEITGAFRLCKSLVEIKLNNLQMSVDFHESPLLNVSQDGATGLGYMIKNALKSAIFTITLAKTLENNADVAYWKDYIVNNGYKITIAFA